MKHRLFVFTDISSLEPGVREPDDGQSLIRLLLYTSAVDLLGLAASSNMDHGQVVRPDLIRLAVDAYAEDFPRLRKHEDGFLNPEVLHRVIYSGQPLAGPRIGVETSIGAGKETEASTRFIETVDCVTEGLLWVAVWGGSADLAQALWSIRESRSHEQADRFLSKIRVHAVGDQDATGPWIKREFPELFYITRKQGIRGMYRGGNTVLTSREWVEEHVKGHGALGELYPSYDGGDIWSAKLGRVYGVKEGDTPSYLNLISGDPLRGWGGTLIEIEPNRWEDAAVPEDSPDIVPGPYPPVLAGVYRHRADFQADFARRLDWCL